MLNREGDLNKDADGDVDVDGDDDADGDADGEDLSRPASPGNLEVEERPRRSLGQARQASQASSTQISFSSKVARWNI